MTDSEGVGERSAASPDELLLAMEPGRDRELLDEWLSTVPGYRVTVADAVPEAATYDLCLVDRSTWRECRERLGEHKAAADPVFLPHLLLAPDAVELAEEGTAVVDDAVSLPVDRGALGRRIENLLRTRRASVRLREREEQYEQLVELTPEGILLVDDGRIRYANRAAADLLGVAEGATLVGRSLDEFADVSSESTLRTLLEDVTTGGSKGEFVDVTFETTSGVSVETAVAGVVVTYEGDRVTQLLVRDLTEERRQQRQVDLLGRAVEAAAQGITVADARQDDTPLVYANAAFEHITGYDSAEVVGRNCRFLQGEETEPETVATIREALDAERSVSVEIRNYRKDGTPFWNQLDIVPVRDVDGAVTHFLGFQRDVTERREREERLTVLNRVLRHNLRNRLNVVLGYAEELADVAEDDEERAAVEHIVDSVEELLDIADQVRSFRKVIGSDRQTLEPHDLVPLIERAAEGLRRERPDATVRLDLPDEATVPAHETLPLALVELFDLAAGAPGTVPDLAVSVTETDGHATVEVVDHGGTIPAAELTVLADDVETAVGHPEGVGAWLLRWVVVYSRGEVAVDAGDGPPTVRLRFPTDGG
ncbi:MAG: PAS domain-containing protein [Haloferacaceae archaeon]